MPAINAYGLALLKNFEGCRLGAYVDPVGVWTIGFGHTPAEPGQTITQAQADALLQGDLQRFETGVNNLCAHSITSNQFSALVCFAYNVGIGALASSTLMRLVNAQEYAAAADQFERWDKGVIDGQLVELPGLLRRRQAERALFLKPEGQA